MTAFQQACIEVGKMDIDGLNKFIAFELTKEEAAAVTQAQPCAA